MNLGFPEMMFLILLALLIFGPKKLPEIGRHIGRGLAEFKRASNDFKHQLEDEVRQLEVEEAGKNQIRAPEGTVAARSEAESSPIGTGSRGEAGSGGAATEENKASAETETKTNA
ncbi:MAG TPA: twin-arginine translocase TatA/TatE family subunit [Terriglobales bacterium]|nr:twin-arginine translocase TatA/TatE family subunit [Terriglobales bacterium]